VALQVYCYKLEVAIVAEVVSNTTPSSPSIRKMPSPLYEDYWGDLDGYFEATRSKLKSHNHSSIDSHLKVAIRCRPIDSRERALNDKCIVTPNSSEGTVTLDLTRIVQGMESASFAYDHVYGPESRCAPPLTTFSSTVGRLLPSQLPPSLITPCSVCCLASQSQQEVFETIGFDALEHAFLGYNVSMFAYGQTSSGKTFSMMGIPGCDDVGLIPRICRTIFHFVELAADEYEVCHAPHLFFSDIALLVR